VDTCSVVILGNVQERRAEAEISRGDNGLQVAVVYESSDGWHTEILEKHLLLSLSDFEAAVHLARERLSHYVNRRGENVPENMTSDAFSFWLLTKDDGTALGISLGDDIAPSMRRPVSVKSE
jgi:hypothetical protein